MFLGNLSRELICILSLLLLLQPRFREVDIKQDGMLGQGQTLPAGQLGKYDCEKGLKALVKNDMNMLKVRDYFHIMVF